jgi:hypothetical protein
MPNKNLLIKIRAIVFIDAHENYFEIVIVYSTSN